MNEILGQSGGFFLFRFFFFHIEIRDEADARAVGSKVKHSLARSLTFCSDERMSERVVHHLENMCKTLKIEGRLSLREATAGCSYLVFSFFVTLVLFHHLFLFQGHLLPLFSPRASASLFIFMPPLRLPIAVFARFLNTTLWRIRDMKRKEQIMQP